LVEAELSDDESSESELLGELTANCSFSSPGPRWSAGEGPPPAGASPVGFIRKCWREAWIFDRWKNVSEFQVSARGSVSGVDENSPTASTADQTAVFMSLSTCMFDAPSAYNRGKIAALAIAASSLVSPCPSHVPKGSLSWKRSALELATEGPKRRHP
jgi:hypothetical protein